MKTNFNKPFKDIILTLILLGLFFMPFNSYEGVSFLGEFSKDSCTLFFIAGFICLVFRSLLLGHLIVPIKNPLFQLFLIFNIWIFISTLLNISDILTYYYKQTTGLNRAIRQYFVLFLSGVIFLVTYYNAFVNVNYEELFLKIRRVFFYSFVVVSVYAIMEILILKFNALGLLPLIKLFDYFPFTNAYIDFRNFRISSVTFEPPALATYLFTIAGWMFSYILTGHGLKKYLPAVITIFLALVSGSRAALLIIFLQFIVFLLMLTSKKYINKLGQILKYTLIVFTVVFILQGRTISSYIYDKATSFEMQDDIHAVSNKSRFGLQYTNFLVFLEKPLFGTGIGQQTFLAKDMYPDWATEDNWEFRKMYLNEEVKSFPPGYNIYIRILAETGIIGFIIFALFLVSILFITYKIIRNQNEKSLLAIVIMVSMVGLMFNWLKMDTFRVFGFWINFSLLLVISKDIIKFSNK